LKAAAHRARRRHVEREARLQTEIEVQKRQILRVRGEEA
jgi:hypothetical protein